MAEYYMNFCLNLFAEIREVFSRNLFTNHGDNFSPDNIFYFHLFKICNCIHFCMKPHMLFQIIQPVTPSITEITLIRHLIALHIHVSIQMTDLLKLFLTNSASIRSLIHMCRSNMSL